MMGIHPNSAKHGISDSVNYSAGPQIDSKFFPISSPWWMPKLSRFKTWVVGVLFLIVLMFSVYKLTVMNQSAPLVQRGSPTGTAFTKSRDPEDEFSDKIRYKHTKRKLPQCIIIGIRKAGTRALLTYLNLHPHIKTAADEIHFFDNEDNYKRGLEWYRKRMPYSFPEEIVIEKTPAYFATRVTPDRVYHMNSSIRLLLVVREPFNRMVSDYLQITEKKQSKGLETWPFEQMVLRDNGEINMSYPPLVRSVYHMYMENWLRKFDLSQFHIVDGDQLIKDPFPEMHAIETFLGVEHRIRKDNFYYNESRGHYCIRNDTKEKCLAESKGRKHPDIDPVVTKKLKDFFKAYNNIFFEQIKRKLDWD